MFERFSQTMWSWKLTAVIRQDLLKAFYVIPIYYINSLFLYYMFWHLMYIWIAIINIIK